MYSASGNVLRRSVFGTAASSSQTRILLDCSRATISIRLYSAPASASTSAKHTSTAGHAAVPAAVLSTVKPATSRKTYAIKSYQRLLNDAAIVLVAHRNNLGKAEQESLSLQIKKAGGQLHVVNKSLLSAYLRSEHEKNPFGVKSLLTNRKKIHPMNSLLVGPTALITVKETDPQVVNKVLKITKAANEKLFVVGARIDKQVYDLLQLAKFKDLPTKEQLQSQLVGLLTILSGAGLVRTLETASQVLYMNLQSHRENIDPASKKDDDDSEAKTSS